MLHLSIHADTHWDNDRLDLAEMWYTRTFKPQTTRNVKLTNNITEQNNQQK